MPLDEYYKIKFIKRMLVNSVQLGSYDNKCLNAKLYFTPLRHESSHDSRCLNTFLMFMVRFNFICWSSDTLRIFMLPGFLCSRRYGKKTYICVVFVCY